MRLIPGLPAARLIPVAHQSSVRALAWSADFVCRGKARLLKQRGLRAVAPHAPVCRRPLTTNFRSTARVVRVADMGECKKGGCTKTTFSDGLRSATDVCATVARTFNVQACKTCVADSHAASFGPFYALTGAGGAWERVGGAKGSLPHRSGAWGGGETHLPLSSGACDFSSRGLRPAAHA